MVIGKNIKNRRTELDMTLEELAKKVKTSRQTISRYENGIIQNIPSDKIELIANALNTTPAYLMGWEDEKQLFTDEEVIRFNVVGSVKAGYGGEAIEELTGETVLIPKGMLGNRPPEAFFALKVKGNSMYPRIIEDDVVLVLRTPTVDSETIAVVIYNSDEATVKKIRYVPGENWFEMITMQHENATRNMFEKSNKGKRKTPVRR